MPANLVLAILAVLAAFTVLGLMIYRWGPGVRTRRVSCPEIKLMASVAFLGREGEFGSLKNVDVVACSLLPPGRLNCPKTCLR